MEVRDLNLGGVRISQSHNTGRLRHLEALNNLRLGQDMAAVASAIPLSTEDLFDDVGPAYESAFAHCEPQAASIDWIKSKLGSFNPAKCLDIGCGTGRPVCSDLANAGHDVLGIDLSGAMIDAAKANVPKARFEKMDIADFQSAPGSFDAITVYFSMIAGVTPDQIRGYIQNIYSWLKPGGIFVFATVPIAANEMEIKWMGRPVVVSSLDAGEAVDWISKVGFEVVRDAVTTFMPKAAEAGICNADDVWEEPHLFVYARKPS